MKSIDEGREAVLAGAWGTAAALVVGLLGLRFGPGWIPLPTDPQLLVAMAAAFLLNASFLGLCYAAFLRLVPRPSSGGLLYGAAFAGANFVIDAAILTAAFRYPGWLPQFSTAQRESVALFLPLVYLGMLGVPLLYDRARQPR